MTMTLQSVGSAIPPTGGGRPGGAGILHTQLDRYQSQLADWCNCPSGKTPEGKRIIADLQQKSDAIKSQLKQSEEVTGGAAGSVAAASARALSSSGNDSSTSGFRLDVLA